MWIGIIKYVSYFIIGGSFVVLATYLASHNKGYWAAFFSTMPILAVISLVTILAQSGVDPAITYAQSLILMTLPFLLFVSVFIWFLPYLGIFPSIIISAAVYVVISAILNWIKKI